MSDAMITGLFGVLAIFAAGVVVYFMIDAKDKHEEQDDDKDRSLPAAPTPSKYKLPGEHPGRPGAKPKGGGGGPHEPL